MIEIETVRGEQIAIPMKRIAWIETLPLINMHNGKKRCMVKLDTGAFLETVSPYGQIVCAMKVNAQKERAGKA